MHAMLDLALPWWGPAVLDLAVKSGIVLGVALLLHTALGSRRTLLRSGLWNACLLGLLLLPVASLALPELRLDLAPSREQVKASSVVVNEPAPRVVEEEAKTVDVPVVVEAPVALPEAPRPAPSFKSAAPRWPVWMAGVYAFGVVAMMLRLAVSLGVIASIRRRSEPVIEPAWTEALEHWRRRIGVRAPVRLVHSARVNVPIVIGVRRAIIVLPESLAASAPPKAIDAVLLHELAHVRRGDYGWNLLLRLLLAVYWPQPLLWLAGRLMGRVRERACDELCLHWMGDEPGYRLTLLELASGFSRRPSISLGMAMSRTTKLGRRLTDLERSTGAARCVLSLPARMAIVGAMVVLVGLLGALKPVRQAGAAPIVIQNTPAQDQDPKVAPGDEPESKPEPRPAPAEEYQIKREDGVHIYHVVRPTKADGRHVTAQPGSVEPAMSADLYAKQEGYIKVVRFDIGDRVKKGDILAEIEAPELEAALARAKTIVRRAEAHYRAVQAAMLTAKAGLDTEMARQKEGEATLEGAEATVNYRTKEFERIQKLVAHNEVESRLAEEQVERLKTAEAAANAAEAALTRFKSAITQAEAQLEEARANAEAAQAEVEVAEYDVKTAEARLAGTRCVCPFDGIVTMRGVQVGDYVRTPANDGSPMFTVIQSDTVRVVVAVPERDVPTLNVGDEAEVTLDALQNGPEPEVFHAKVSRVGVTISPETRTLRAEVDLPNPEGKIRVGMYGTVKIILGVEPDAALAVPRSAVVLRQRAGQQLVYGCCCVVEGQVIRKRVYPLESDADRAVIESGLSPDDLVIIDPDDRLQPDEAIERVGTHSEPAEPDEAPVRP